jgi:ERCC4-type nuclease
MWRYSRFLIQRRTSAVDAIKANRTREFFKTKWLETKIFPTPNLTPKIQKSVSVDSRETSLVECIQVLSPFASISVSQLSEGDIVISDPSSSKRIVIERKSVDDFYNSINSKRLFDQIGRIFETSVKNFPETILVIVLEGQLCSASTPPGVYKTVTSMYHSLLLRDKISVIRTDSITETARLVLSMASSSFGKFFAQPNEFATLVHVERYGRKLNGMNVPYLRLLMSIHGISANRAHAIAQAYPTMDLLVSGLKEGGTARLARLVAPSSNRSIGSPIGFTTAVNIAEALLGPSDPEVAVFKLYKYLSLNAKISNGEAMRLAKEYKSLPDLRRAHLSGLASELPEAVDIHLSSTVNDPAFLLTGLKGVRSISTRTAESIVTKFNCVRGIFQHMLASPSLQDAINEIRLVGTLGGTLSVQKRMISRTAVENMIAWLDSEGFIPSSIHK